MSLSDAAQPDTECVTDARIGRLRTKAVELLVFCFCFVGYTAVQAQQAPAGQASLQAADRASAALQAGDYAAAERLFREALIKHPDSVPLLNNLAITLARQQKEQEAITFYRRALALDPNNAFTQRNLGLVYFRAKQYRLALPLLEVYAASEQSFQALDLTGIDLFALDRFQESIHYLELAHTLQPTDMQTLDLLGKAYLRTKNYAAVTHIFEQVMAIDPDSAAAHCMMGMAYDKLFREQEAIQEFKAAEKNDPEYPGIHTGLGLIYWRNDELESAEHEFRQELAAHPTDPIANCTLGRILRRQNRNQQAIPFLQAALAINPGYLDALRELSQCLLSTEHFEEAATMLERAIAISPEEAETHYMLGTALMKQGDAAAGARERARCAALLAKQRSTRDSKHEEQ